MMIEHKPTEGGVLHEMLLPLPLESALNRLTNRVAKHRCQINLVARDSQQIELAVEISNYFRQYWNQPALMEVFMYRETSFKMPPWWRTTVILTAVAANKTRLTYFPPRMTPTIVVSFLPVFLLAVWLAVALPTDPHLLQLLLVSVGGTTGVLLLAFWQRRRVLVRLLKGLEQGMGE